MAKVSRPTETERCIESLIAVFQKHAGRDGNNSKLSKAELDLNSDGQLEFQEFLNLIGGLAIACHESFIKSASCQK
ncbi:hypothetical protein FD755_018669 [Muntiacus reevesi]|uniref:EF-hand domain-containing protein n=2 Tax=Muntiacus TaxID=9885 RepID=A0A5N3X949_MUNRE|nr:hypothetical protein FD754_014235 [Muntiacus muntjak]KAB0369676.1 hypothetical protein FD755_018669 [Muntiacus reevesi]